VLAFRALTWHIVLLYEQAGCVTGHTRTRLHKELTQINWVMKLMFHLPCRCHLNKDVPLIPKAFTHHEGWQCWVIFKLFCLAHGKQE